MGAGRNRAIRGFRWRSTVFANRAAVPEETIPCDGVAGIAFCRKHAVGTNGDHVDPGGAIAELSDLVGRVVEDLTFGAGRVGALSVSMG